MRHFCKLLAEPCLVKTVEHTCGIVCLACCNVLPEGQCQKLEILKYHREYLHVVIVTIFSNIDAVEQYFAFGRVIQTAKQLYEGCFAAAVHSHNCETAAHFELHVHMAECIRFTAGIFERHITKFNIILNIAALFGGEAALIHCVRSIQKLKHCVKET